MPTEGDGQNRTGHGNSESSDWTDTVREAGTADHHGQPGSAHGHRAQSGPQSSGTGHLGPPSGHTPGDNTQGGTNGTSRRGILKYAAGGVLVGGVAIWALSGDGGDISGGSNHVNEYPYVSIANNELQIDVDQYMGDHGRFDGLTDIQIMAEIDGEEYWHQWAVQPFIDGSPEFEGERGRLLLRTTIDGEGDTPMGYILPPLPCDGASRPCEAAVVYFNEAFRTAVGGSPDFYLNFDASNGSLSGSSIGDGLYGAEIEVPDLATFYGANSSNARWVFVGDLEYRSGDDMYYPADNGIALWAR